jgi:predicted nucleotidyltransferase
MNVLTPEQLDALLADIGRRLKAEFGPCRFYLFGSYAAGLPLPESDLDLMVVIPESSESPLRRCVRAVRALSGVRVPKDVIVRTEAEFERRAGWASSLERTVKEKGRLLHAA